MKKDFKVQIQNWKGLGRRAALVLAMTAGIAASAVVFSGCSASTPAVDAPETWTQALEQNEQPKQEEQSEQSVPSAAVSEPSQSADKDRQEETTGESAKADAADLAAPTATVEPADGTAAPTATIEPADGTTAPTIAMEPAVGTEASTATAEPTEGTATSTATVAEEAAASETGAAKEDMTAQETPTKEPLNVNVSTSSPDDAHTGPGVVNQQELKGVWISYLEWNTLPKEQQAFQAAVNQMFDNCVSLGMNAVFVHVRPDADAMYPSAYFPWSKFASGQQGLDPGYDPLVYMIEAAHSRNLQFHAWFNPYRVTGYLNSWEDVAASNPAKVWLTDSDPSNDRWVLSHDGFYYFNPSIPQVRELIINGVKEVVSNYNVDGIHFDDYFYPTLNNANPALWFDKPEYDASGSALDITNWRRGNINQLVRGVYAAVKEIKPNVVFGISPAGYVANLRSDAKLFVDIDTWMSQPGYIDYIMPQLYWGFEAKTSDKNGAPYAFMNNLNTWIELKNRGNVKLYLGLAMSRAGTNVADNNEVSEWLRYNDILKRQVETARASQAVKGYCFFSYSSFYEASAQGEVANLLPILK